MVGTICWVVVGAMLVYSWLNVGVYGLWLAHCWVMVGTMLVYGW